jgi:uncharacterized protein YciI
MPLYLMLGRDGPRGLDLRKQHRDAHIAKLEELAQAGRIQYAGPLLDPAGKPCGSAVVFEAEDLDQARAIAAADPYVTGGIFASHEVLATRRVFPE